MENTKKTKTIIGVTVGVIAVAVIIAAIIMIGGNTNPLVADDPNDATTVPPTDSVIVIPPTEKPPLSEAPTGTEEEDDEGLVIDVGGTDDPEGNDDPADPPPDTTEKPTEQPAKPVETKQPDPPPTTNNNGGGIQIGGGETPAPYDCGVANHHCEGPETHAFIANLEKEGCPTCGSHSCPSFYGTDQWGNGGLFPNLCPKYDVKNDPLHYCQDCGKKTGDGTNDTCVRFINAMKCPLCGVDVPGRTCHTCK